MQLHTFTPILALLSAALVAADQCGIGNPCPASAPCCSQYGWCGTTADYCTNCKCGCPGAPACESTPTDKMCYIGKPCPGSTPCCSKYNYCGSTDDYCGADNLCGGPGKPSCSGDGPNPPTPGCGLDLRRKDNMVLYWGQNGNEGRLRDFCSDSTYDIIILSFMSGFPSPMTLNFAGHCWSTYPSGLLHCSEIASDIKYCRSQGKAVLLSMGGANGAYSFSSQWQAEQFAGTVWNTFLGGSASERPFDDAVLDGVDLDLEAGGYLYYSHFVNKLRQLAGSSRVIVGAAPQCPFADNIMGPDGISWNGNNHVGTVLSNSHIDFVSVQFYNNGPCNLGQPGFRNGGSSFSRWHEWVSSLPEYTALFVGSPASSASAGSGYVSDDALKGELQFARGFSHFGGLMMWDANGSRSSGRGTTIAPWLKSFDPRSC
eukprot:m51a1_g8809 putative glycosyl family 18 domain containing protein (429) ;mRNA; f:283786-285866